MLVRLEIRNVVLIDHLELEIGSGLSALSGETGAGKSILLDALSLIRGDRADASLIRQGADQASVTAVFEVPSHHDVRTLLIEQGVPADDLLILRRVIGRDGKSRAFINDTTVGVGLIKTVGQMLIDLHGQFETGHLFDPIYHRRMLDQFGGLGEQVSQVNRAWETWAAARHQVDHLSQLADQAARDADYIHNAFEDLSKLKVQPDEEGYLIERKNFLQSRAQIGEGLTAILEDLQGETGAAPALSRVARHLDRLRAKMPSAIETWLTSLDSLLEGVRDLAANVEASLFDTGDGLNDLEQIDDRLHELRAASRRYHCQISELPDKCIDFQTRMNDINLNADALTAARSEMQRAENHYLTGARTLSRARREAATGLNNALMQELPPLKLDKAQFLTDIQEISAERYGRDGVDAVRFLVAMNVGGDFAPLDRVASGGELSRLMLALKVVLRDERHVCMIFDEVDSGLGGAVAAAMADRLSRLAQGSQVLVVTHAPQVAARADHHWVVSKKTDHQKTTTRIEILSKLSDRREEIARMLSGEMITDEARAAAQKLMDTRIAS